MQAVTIPMPIMHQKRALQKALAATCISPRHRTRWVSIRADVAFALRRHPSASDKRTGNEFCLHDNYLLSHTIDPIRENLQRPTVGYSPSLRPSASCHWLFASSRLTGNGRGTPVATGWSVLAASLSWANCTPRAGRAAPTRFESTWLRLLKASCTCPIGIAACDFNIRNHAG